VIKAALSQEEQLTTKRESITESAPIATDSNTQTMFNSNVPLNQQLVAAVDLESLSNPNQFEGGESELTTERGLTTDRPMISVAFKQQESAENKQKTLYKVKIQREANLRLKLEDLV